MADNYTVSPPDDWKRYTVTYSDGTTETVNADTLAGSGLSQSNISSSTGATSGYGATIEFDAGEMYFKNTLPDSVTLDTDTNSSTYGDVKITASSAFLNSDVYQGTDTTTGYKEILEALSTAYKTDPDYAFALEEDGETKTAEEWIKSLAEDINDLSSSWFDYDRERRKVNYLDGTSYNMEQWQRRNTYATSYTLTDEDLANGLTDTSSGSTMIAIPSWFGKKYLEDVEGYDAENGLISKEDFLNGFWNSSNLSDEELMRVAYQVRDRAESNADKDNMDDYAADQALYDTLRGVAMTGDSDTFGRAATTDDRNSRYYGIGEKIEDADRFSDTAETVGMTIGSIVWGGLEGAGKMVTGLAEGVAKMFDWVDENIVKGMDEAAGFKYEPANMVENRTGWMEEGLTNSEEYFDEATEKWEWTDPGVTGVFSISKSVGNLVTELTMTAALTKGVSGIVAAGVDTLANAVGAAAGTAAEGAVATEAANTAAKGETIAKITTFSSESGEVLVEGATLTIDIQKTADVAALTSEAISSLKKVGYAAEVADAAANAFKIGVTGAMSTSKALTVAETVSEVSEATRIATEAVAAAGTLGKQLAVTYKVAQALTEITTLAYVGAAVSDHTNFYRLMSADELSAEDKAYLTGQMIEAGAWYAGGVLLTKAAWGFKNTGVGKALNNVLSPKLAAFARFGNRINSKLNDFTDWLKSVVRGGSADASTAFRETVASGTKTAAMKRAAANAQYNVIRRTEAEMMNKAYTALSKANTAAEVASAKIALEAVDNAITDLKQGEDLYMSAFYNESYNPEYAKASKNLTNSYTETLQAASEATGLTDTMSEKTVDKSGLVDGVAGAMPIEVNDYIAAKLNLPQALDVYVSEVYGAAASRTDFSFDLDNTKNQTDITAANGDPFSGAGSNVITLKDIRDYNSALADRITDNLGMINTLLDLKKSGQVPALVIEKANETVDALLHGMRLRRGVITGGLAGDIPGFNQPIVNAGRLRQIEESGVFGKNGQDYFPSASISEIPIDVKGVGRYESDYAMNPDEFKGRKWGHIDHYQDVLVTYVGKQMDDAYRMSRNAFLSSYKEQFPGVFTDVAATADEVMGGEYAAQRGKVKKALDKVVKNLNAPKKSMGAETADIENSDYPLVERISAAILPEETIEVSLYGNPVEEAKKNLETLPEAVADEEECLAYLLSSPIYEQTTAADVLGKGYLTLFCSRTGSFETVPDAVGEDADLKIIRLTNDYWYTKSLGGDVLVVAINKKDIDKTVFEVSQSDRLEFIVKTKDPSSFFTASWKLMANAEFIKREASAKKAEEMLARNQKAYEDLLEKFGENYGEIDKTLVLKMADDTAAALIFDLEAGNHGLVSSILSAESASADATIRTLTADYRAAEYLLTNFTDIKSTLSRGLTEVNEEKIDKIAKIKARDTEDVLSFKTVADLKRRSEKNVTAFVDMVKQKLQERQSDYGNLLTSLGSDVPSKNVRLTQALRDLDEKITGIKKSANVIGAVDGTLYQVDPLLADFYNFKPIRADKSTFERIRQVESKVFRYGTTTMNIKSIFNQYIKDPVSAVVNGNLDILIYGSHDAIAREFGDELADHLDAAAPEILSYMKKTYGEGSSLYRGLENRMSGILSSRTSQSTEVSSYQFRKRERWNKLLAVSEGKQGAKKIISDYLGKVGSKVNNIIETPSRFREEGLRKGVGLTNFRDALKNGMTVEQAYTHARWTMDNATTNFGRSSYWWHNFTSSIPYANAAFNGFKSFTKMLILDPVGIMSRMITGLIAPAVFFTIQNLGSEENRKAYDNIPEWQRASSLVIVLDGRAYAIPLPEQMTALISPWRHAVEMLYGANKAEFWKLAMNDFFDFMPIDMTGFVNIDTTNLLAEDSDFVEQHLKPGFSKMASSLLSPIEKSVVMAATGYDPYTNTPINPGYVTLDDDGNAIVTSSTATNLGQAVSNLFGGNVSPGMAQKVLESLMGRANTAVLDGLVTLAEGIAENDLGSAASYILSGIGDMGEDMVSADVYNRNYSSFFSYANILKQEKASLLADEKLEKYIETVNSTSSSDEERAEAKARIKDIVNDYYNRVLLLVNNYKERTGAGLSRQQFASVLQLMNLETGGGASSLLSADSSYLANLATDEYLSGRANAVQTMAEMGFSSVSDNSIFGYYKENSDGTYQVIYSDPISILNYNYTDWQQSKLIMDKLEDITKDSNLDLYNRYQEVWDKLTPLYQNAKANSDKIMEIQLTWNGQVMEAYNSVIKSLGAAAVLSSNDAIREIGTYMFVPYSYTKGSYLTSGGTKKDAYIKSYIKYLYGVN